MRKEILGLLLLFLVIFTMTSIISYQNSDPSIHNAVADQPVKNLFGTVGAHTAAVLISLFGLGSIWVPILMLMASIRFFSGKTGAIWQKVLGGILLLVTTGSLLSFWGESYDLMNATYRASGIVGIPVKVFLVQYANHTGGAIILGLLWLIGFIMTTGFSLVSFLNKLCFIVFKFLTRVKNVFAGSDKKKKKQEKQQNLLIKQNRPVKKQKEPAKKTSQASLEDIVIQTSLKKNTSKLKAGSKPKTNAKAQNSKPDIKVKGGKFQLPDVSFLENQESRPDSVNEENLRMQSKLLEQKLEDFGVRGQVTAATPGPVITTFEYAPAPGVKINKIVNLTDDLALALRAVSIRIVAPIPGRDVIGIEVPNENRETVRMKEIVASRAFEKSKSKLTLCLGKDIEGSPVVSQMDKMPHLLIAGATGAGKSVGLNTMICSILYKAKPDEVKMIMVDPKRIELSAYDGIPHLITPVVTDAKKATNALFWAVREMERRYELLSNKKARNISQYNQKAEHEIENAKKKPVPESEAEQEPEVLPYIVIVIDELADMMMVASRDVEVALTRLAQMARAAGIHLILATQRPSVDVLTGIIKANFPTRLTFQVSSKIDSRTIIDTNGAENLLGMGDMLFLPPGTARLKRIHGAYISETELSQIIEFLKKQKPPEYNETVVENPNNEKREGEQIEYDERYDDAVVLVTKTRQASISMIQRHLRIGYNRAARIIEVMEQEGIVGPSDGVKPRQVLVGNYDDIP
ncbi:MAG: DNA translocase FtsK [Desulfobacteraceae bacterium]|nr:DNA translocase FtsK [Desulfobacteraceae bacterium]